MNREQLEHVLRAAARIAADPDVLVIGSQSLLGAITHDQLPLAATASMEVDVAFFDDPDDRYSLPVGETAWSSSRHPLPRRVADTYLIHTTA